MGKTMSLQSRQKGRPAKKSSKKVYEYNYKIGGTDYDIPAFSFKSAFVIMTSIILTMFIVPAVCELLNTDYRMWTIVIGGLVSGYSCAFTQYFIEHKRGFQKGFWISGGLLSLFTAMFIFVVVYTGIIL